MSSKRPTFQAVTVGIVGAGQLARMTLPVSESMAIDIRLLAERHDDGAALIGKHVELGSPQSVDDLRRFAAGCDVVTFDHELVNADALRTLQDEGAVIRPSADVVALVQDKLAQRELMRSLDLTIPAFEAVRNATTIASFSAAHGWPIVAKAVRGGYDGRGVWILREPQEARQLLSQAGANTAVLFEEWIPIDREIATLVARRPSGEMAVFPVVETVQVDGICHELKAPAGERDDVARRARDIALTIAEAIQLEGLLAVELFVSNGALVVNELAARPHNSGHFTIEGCRTSQFAQHVRAVLDLPLGDTSLTAPAVATVNVLGGPNPVDPRSRLSAALGVPGCSPHLYGKGYRPGRKLGHVTAVGTDPDETMARARQAARLLVTSEE
jgi:5-(carboxyamino)imidazole ribonucleotide synthase